MSKETPGVRFAEVDRESSETRISVVLDIDGGTKRDISTGIAFFDHMLQQLAFHGHFDVGIKAEGDLHIDDHHTVEDVGIVLGRALKQALDGGEPIARYASNHSVMDESLILVALDISGRAGLFYEVDFSRDMVGGLATENVREFFRSFTAHAGITLHIRKVTGENDHHIIEAIFKGMGRALHEATRKVDRRGGVSTKGFLD